MKALPFVEITRDEDGRTVVKVDGVKVEGCRSFNLSQFAGDVPMLSLEIYVGGLSVDLSYAHLACKWIGG